MALVTTLGLGWVQGRQAPARVRERVSLTRARPSPLYLLLNEDALALFIFGKIVNTVCLGKIFCLVVIKVNVCPNDFLKVFIYFL